MMWVFLTPPVADARMSYIMSSLLRFLIFSSCNANPLHNFEIAFIDSVVEDSVLRFQIYIIFVNFMIIALKLLFMVIFNCDRPII